ncbi:phage/plasmid primase, P4 family [Rhizobium sp. RU36D]|uniref:phage/plasmid primase, P4 family n=1 Tax=Rhizobium sp. RU36D TaxID=1907415 RepID=UPI0009D887AC|nr:phage/plasmid primase, P4 family [Rhizobium sp. RU36D]SMD18555.1 putative DNA primase/helicase [Rhizobium sp. RU36D]
MADKKKPSEMPEAVRAKMAEAAAQRAGRRMDPIPVEEPLPEEDHVELSPHEVLEECAREPETDIGNGRRLRIRYGDRILYVVHIGWHGYDGKRWVEDASGAMIRKFAHATAEFIDEEAIKLDCTPQDQAAIEAGKIALERMRQMGKPPSVSSEIDEDRMTELDQLIDDAEQAGADRIRMGAPKSDWPDEMIREYQQIMNTIKLGREAERQKKKMKDATHQWSESDYEEYDRLQNLVKRMDEAQEARDGRMSTRHTFARSSAGTNRINNMQEEAKPYCSVTVDELNVDDYAVNTQNGTLRFFRKEVDDGAKWVVRLDRHKASDRISKIVDASFVPDTACYLFDRFLTTIQPNPDIRAFLQRLFGYCLLGAKSEQILVFFYGIGSNGKSTLLKVIGDIMGDYTVTMSIDSFAGEGRRGGGDATPDLARLPSSRFVVASEPEEGIKLKDALIKVLTGGTKIPARRLQEDFFEFIPKFQMIIDGNHKPVIRDNSDGTWRRVKLIPFLVQVLKDQVDKDLSAKLMAEKDGILAWMVRGALEYLNYGLRIPEGIEAATAEYREESDPVGAFIRNACFVTGVDTDRVEPDELHIAYLHYAKREGLFQFNSHSFGKRLTEQMMKAWLGPDGQMHQFVRKRNNGTEYRGLRIRPEFAKQTGAPPSDDEMERDFDPFERV